MVFSPKLKPQSVILSAVQLHVCHVVDFMIETSGLLLLRVNKVALSDVLVSAV